MGLSGTLLYADSNFTHFVTSKGDKLMDGEKELRFISFNIPNLHYIEDNVPFTELNAWRLPNEFEIVDALKAVKQSGGQVVRIYTLSVKKEADTKDIPRHVLSPGDFNEEAFRALDKVMHQANKIGIRVIIPFVDNWSWWGGRAEYEQFRGKKKDEFWSDPQIIEDFKKTISFLINRKNTITNIKYKDDKAIFAWETGNELQCPHEWTRKIISHIKSLDKNHLVIDGFHTSELRQESVDDPLVDIVTTHHYQKDPQQIIYFIKENQKMAKGKKPFFVGEFGFIDTPGVKSVLACIADEGLSGGLIWSLRFRNRDGGFYWHSEPYGGDLFKAYLWPGFPSGDPYDEVNLCKLMRQKAYDIQGLPLPEISLPDPPLLLPIQDIANISWQGSVGARFYIVERSLAANGPWEQIAHRVIETETQYRPLFNDDTAEIGTSYYYRLKAVNSAGESGPSNIVGPIYVERLTLVDELKDFSKLDSQYGHLTLEMKEARKFKEDLHRARCPKQGVMVYNVPGDIKAIYIYAFFENEVVPFDISVSVDKNSFQTISSHKRSFYAGTGEYGYWKPVMIRSTEVPPGNSYIKIKARSEVQISRIEIKYE